MNQQLRYSLLLMCCGSITGALAQGPPMIPTAELPQAKDPATQSIRAARAAYFNHMAQPDGVALDARDPKVPAPPPVQRLPPPMEELPATLADAIVVGKIVGVQSFFSQNRGAIYTESTIQIEEVISARQTISKGGTLVIVQEGGAIQAAPGSIYTQEVKGGGDALQDNEEYLFFLRNLPALQAYGCRKAWLLADGVVSAVSADDLSRAASKTSTYQGMSVPAFLSVARALKATLDTSH
jgi:hypothetical protein